MTAKAFDSAARQIREEKTRALWRCIDAIEFVCNTAIRSAVSYVETHPSDEVEQLVEQPDVLVIKVIGDALQCFASGGRKPGMSLH